MVTFGALILIRVVFKFIFVLCIGLGTGGWGLQLFNVPRPYSNILLQGPIAIAAAKQAINYGMQVSQRNGRHIHVDSVSV